MYMDSNTKQEQEDVFNKLPDHLLHLIFNKVHDAKSLTNFLTVSKRFYSLIPTQTHVVSLTLPYRHSQTRKNTPLHFNNNNSIKPTPTKHNHLIARILNKVFFKPLKSIFKIAKTTTSCSHCHHQENTFDLVNQALTTFESIKSLQIELPSVEMEPKFLKWKAEFGTKLESCVIFGATSSSIYIPDGSSDKESSSTSSSSSYFTEDELKIRIVWVISSLMAASARHYMIGEVVKKHKEIEKVVISDGSKQGRICMDKRQVEESRECEHEAEDVLAERSKVPGLRMKLWYVPELELKLRDRSVMVLKGATLVVVRPKEERVKYWGSDRDLVKGAFGEENKVFYEAAMKMVKKKKIYTLELNSF